MGRSKLCGRFLLPAPSRSNGVAMNDNSAISMFNALQLPDNWQENEDWRRDFSIRMEKSDPLLLLMLIHAMWFFNSKEVMSFKDFLVRHKIGFVWDNQYFPRIK